MSTTSAPRRLGPIVIEGAAAVPFRTLVKVELRKSWDTRAGLWLLVLTAAFTTIAMVIALIVTTTQDVGMDLSDFIATTAYTSAFLLPVLGILLVTSEWSQRTAMVTFTLEPHRGRVIVAKLVAGLALAAAVAAVALVAALVSNLLYAALEGVSPSWEFGAARLGGFLLAQAFAMLIGFALATLLLNTPAAIVAYFAYSFLLPTIFAVAAVFLDWFETLRPWIDFNLAQAPLFDATMTGKGWGHLVVSGLVWLVLPLALGMWRVLRAEVK